MVLRLLLVSVIAFIYSFTFHKFRDRTEQEQFLHKYAVLSKAVWACIDSIHNYISCYIYPIIVISISNGAAGCALISTVSSCITDGLCNLGESG